MGRVWGESPSRQAPLDKLPSSRLGGLPSRNSLRPGSLRAASGKPFEPPRRPQGRQGEQGREKDRRGSGRSPTAGAASSAPTNGARRKRRFLGPIKSIGPRNDSVGPSHRIGDIIPKSRDAATFRR